MKISEMIRNLHEFMEEYGDLDCWYASDDEGNTYHKVYFEPGLMCIDKSDGEAYTLEDAEDMEISPDEYTKVCVVN